MEVRCAGARCRSPTTSGLAPRTRGPDVGVAAALTTAIFGRQFKLPSTQTRRPRCWRPSRTRLAPPPWAPFFECALFRCAPIRSQLPPPAAPPRTILRRSPPAPRLPRGRARTVGARAIYCSARRRCRRSSAHSRAAPTLPRVAPRRAEACLSAGLLLRPTAQPIDCPRSPVSSLRPPGCILPRRRDRPANDHREAPRALRDRRHPARRRGHALVAVHAEPRRKGRCCAVCSFACAFGSDEVETNQPTGQSDAVRRARVRRQQRARARRHACRHACRRLRARGRRQSACRWCRGGAAPRVGGCIRAHGVCGMCVLSCRRCPACALLAPAPATAVRC
jgi:hypothetical protein